MYTLTKETFTSPPSGMAVLSAAFLPTPPAVASTFFLFTLGSPSALSAACLFTPAPVGGPKYAASSFTFLRAWGRDREPAITVLVRAAAAAEELDCGAGMNAREADTQDKRLFVDHTHSQIRPKSV
jgi:hypothetical protein